jgi:hypothetical protein
MLINSGARHIATARWNQVLGRRDQAVQRQLVFYHHGFAVR